MAGLTLFSLLLLCVSLQAHGRMERYDGFQAFEYTPRSAAHMRLMERLHAGYAGDRHLLFWKLAPAPLHNGTFMVSPRAARRVLDHLRSNGVRLRQTSNNVQRLIDRQRFQNRLLRQANFNAASARQPHTYFMRYAEMKQWMMNKRKACLHPLTCEIKSIGKSHQGRDLLVFTISANIEGERRNKKAVWIDAGIHPREWIAPSTALYLIKKLLGFGDDAKKLLKKFKFYIMPLMNPDGYEYTHTHSRFWRKNLVQSNYYCTGVDLNRNFGYQWGGTGSSDSPCADNYRGERAFSEPETIAVKRHLHSIHRSILVFITLHSYGQYILTPFGHRKDYYPINKRQLINLGNSMAQRIELFSGRFYDVGSAADLLYEASGGSTDYASARLNIPYTYTVELPDTGRYAFFLPPEYIKQVGKEMWVALKEVGGFV